MPRGGRRPGAGRKRQRPDAGPAPDRSLAARVLALPPDAKPTDPRELGWHELLWTQDLRVRLDTRKYLTDRELGKAVQNINHIHDKPVELNVRFSLAEELEKARLRATQLRKKL